MDEFDRWVGEQRERDQCTDLYSFTKEFGLDYQTLEKVILEKGLTELYPLERLKARAEVFGVPAEGYQAFLAAAAENGITQEETRSLETQGLSREQILNMTRKEADEWLDEAKRLAQENYDKEILSRFGENFLELARSGEGAYYDAENNRLVGRGKIESFIRAVEKKDTGGLVYFSDSDSEPYIYSMSIEAGDDFCTVDRYQRDGTKERFASKEAYKGETYYRFSNELNPDAFSGGFLLYIPFGSSNPAS